MRHQGDFFNVGSNDGAAPPAAAAAYHSSSLSAGGAGDLTNPHLRRVSNPPPTVMVNALPTHVRDRSGGSGPTTTSGTASTPTTSAFGGSSGNTTSMARQHSTGIGISFDNTNSFLNIPSTPAAAPSSFEGRTLSGGNMLNDGGGGFNASTGSLSGTTDPEEELPILEELGIRPDHIRDKVKLVLNPFSSTSSHELCMDEDLAGPLTFALCLGFLLTLQGKIHFGAIYGISVIGILLAYFILTMMSQSTESPVRMTLVVSTLGYCLLPDLILAGFVTGHIWLFGRAAGTGLLLTVLCAISIMWSAWCSMKIFAEAFNLHHVRYLILYPSLLFYAVFAAITMF